MREVIFILNNFIVNAKELWECLGCPQGEFRKFAKRKITSQFNEDKDYIIHYSDNQYGFNKLDVAHMSDYQRSRYGISTNYLLTQESAKAVCLNTKITNENKNKAENFINIDNKEVIFIEQKRKEYQFRDLLKTITGINWEEQYPIDKGKYKLDFYLKNTLIVEYDENHHTYQKHEDNERMNYCRKWLAETEGSDSNWMCPIIRVKEGQELEGLNKIIRHLSINGIFDSMEITT